MKFRISNDDLKNAKRMMDILFMQIARTENETKEQKDMAAGIFTSSLILSELLESGSIEFTDGEHICEFSNDEEEADGSDEM